MKIVQTSIIAGLAFFLSIGISFGADLDDIDFTIRVVESDDVDEMHNELLLPDMAFDVTHDGHVEGAADRENQESRAGEHESDVDTRDEREDEIEDHDEAREDNDDVSDEHDEAHDGEHEDEHENEHKNEHGEAHEVEHEKEDN
ncbi:MAG: hypothetical protein L3J84_12030 [Gammaproteobacteria bacterium]|nr:hypothetical protein [Gammaproteobacteria bacterium]